MKLKTIYHAIKDIVLIILIVSGCIVFINPNVWIFIFSKYPPF